MLAAKAPQPAPEVPDRPLVELLGVRRADLDVVGGLAGAAGEDGLKREAAGPGKWVLARSDRPLSVFNT